MVLIGGNRRPYAEQSLKEAFGLRELFWITTREHESNDGFEPYIARPDVALVLLAIRWSSHSYGDVRVFCERHGRPLVRLPAGCNANQLRRGSCGHNDAHLGMQSAAVACPDHLPAAGAIYEAGDLTSPRRTQSQVPGGALASGPPGGPGGLRKAAEWRMGCLG